MRKFKFSKLVRDKIVDGIISVGNKPDWRKLEKPEYIEELKKKMVEETMEVPGTKNPEELVKELADVQEIIDNLLETLKVSKKRFAEIQKKKNEKAGSFKKRQFIEDVETNDDDSEWVKYYLANSDKYPEIKS